MTTADLAFRYLEGTLPRSGVHLLEARLRHKRSRQAFVKALLVAEILRELGKEWRERRCHTTDTQRRLTATSDCAKRTGHGKLHSFLIDVQGVMSKRKVNGPALINDWRSKKHSAAHRGIACGSQESN